MSSKKVSLTGEVHISTGSIYTTVDALEANPGIIQLIFAIYPYTRRERRRVRLSSLPSYSPAFTYRRFLRTQRILKVRLHRQFSINSYLISQFA